MNNVATAPSSFDTAFSNQSAWTIQGYYYTSNDPGAQAFFIYDSDGSEVYLIMFNEGGGLYNLVYQDYQGNVLSWGDRSLPANTCYDIAISNGTPFNGNNNNVSFYVDNVLFEQVHSTSNLNTATVTGFSFGSSGGGGGTGALDEWRVSTGVAYTNFPTTDGAVCTMTDTPSISPTFSESPSLTPTPTFTYSETPIICNYSLLVVGAGGAGGNGTSSPPNTANAAGGGGGGGYIEASILASSTTHFITVGQGGSGQGGASSFDSYLALGGGYGGSGSTNPPNTGGSGGGGSSGYNSGATGTSGQGNNGGNGSSPSYGGGGGGATAGGQGPSGVNGGAGITSSISGSSVTYGGGGGGGKAGVNGSQSTGGGGGGGKGSFNTIVQVSGGYDNFPATSGTNGLGGGGGGGSGLPGITGVILPGGQGGGGTVILSVPKFCACGPGVATGSFTMVSTSTAWIFTWTGSGTYVSCFVATPSPTQTVSPTASPTYTPPAACWPYLVQSITSTAANYPIVSIPFTTVPNAVDDLICVVVATNNTDNQSVLQDVYYGPLTMTAAIQVPSDLFHEGLELWDLWQHTPSPTTQNISIIQPPYNVVNINTIAVMEYNGANYTDSLNVVAEKSSLNSADIPVSLTAQYNNGTILAGYGGTLGVAYWPDNYTNQDYFHGFGTYESTDDQEGSSSGPQSLTYTTLATNPAGVAIIAELQPVQNAACAAVPTWTDTSTPTNTFTVSPTFTPTETSTMEPTPTLVSTPPGGQ